MQYLHAFHGPIGLVAGRFLVVPFACSASTASLAAVGSVAASSYSSPMGSIRRIFLYQRLANCQIVVRQSRAAKNSAHLIWILHV